jgi:glycosyltransferase involved in cell wall biosynthesis
VLAFPEGAAPEVVDHGRTGFLCRDEAEMADAVLKLDELDRVACRAAVEGYFSTERMVNEHVELYQELLK